MFLLLLVMLPGLMGQQCERSADCKSPYAPHCSKWGWCQWTSQYGDSGPVEVPSSGYCNSNKECVPRAPFCSRQGYCTQRPLRPGNEDQQIENRFKTKTSLMNQQRNIEHKEKFHRIPVRSQEETVNQDSRMHDRDQSNKIRPNLEEDPRGGVLPSGTFLLNQMQSTFGLRRSGNEDTILKDRRNIGRSFHPSPPLTQFQRPDPAPLPFTTPPPPPQDPIDRQSSNHYNDYQYDYNYYMDFEVQKTVVIPEDAVQEGRSGDYVDYFEDTDGVGEAIKEHPKEGESQGCLYDCVYDCVSISQLTAYRDCVDFCGKTCNNKK